MSENIKGRFGKFGGQYVAETLMNVLVDLEKEFEIAIEDKEFLDEFDYYMKDYVGRESPLYYAENFSKKYGKAKVYLKREDLNHTGAHKINNAIGQVLLAKRMGKKRIIAETGAGQHGVATATAAALFGMSCDIYMGEEDMKRQALNVFKMEALGAKVVPVSEGCKTLADAVDAALKNWVAEVDTTFYVLGSAVGPHPYPSIVKYFQSIISKEAKVQILEKEGRLPDYVVACVGGGSNAIGMFSEFIEHEEVQLIGVEPGGQGIETDKHAATMAKGSVGIIHGMKTYVLQDEDGQISPVYSISAGLDYPGVGPEHSYLKDIKRASYESVTDDESVDAFMELTRLEGIIPAIESAHAIAHVMKLAKDLDEDKIIIVSLSGRGDKDVARIARLKGVDVTEED